MENRADGGGEFFREGECEEVLEGGDLPGGICDELRVIDFEEFDVFSLAEGGEGLVEVGLLGLDEVQLFGAGLVSVPSEHGPLGIDDFGDGALHEDDAVAVAGGELGKEGGDDFDAFSLGFLDEAGVFPQGFDVLPFPVAFGVVLVGGAFAIVHDLHSCGAEHLHHEGGAGAREAGDDGKSFPGGCGRVFRNGFGGGFAFALPLGVAGFGAGGGAVAEGVELALLGEGVGEAELHQAVVVFLRFGGVSQGFVDGLECGEGGGVFRGEAPGI